MSDYGSKIETVSKIKFLGFYLDSKFKFTAHAKHLNKNLARCNYNLTKCSKFLNSSHLKLIFNAIGLSHINYINVLLMYLSKKDTDIINWFFNS